MVHNNVLLLIFIFITVLQTETFSAFTDHDSQNGTSSNKSEMDYKTVDVFRCNEIWRYHLQMSTFFTRLTYYFQSAFSYIEQ